jgi:hypothetical protein
MVFKEALGGAVLLWYFAGTPALPQEVPASRARNCWQYSAEYKTLCDCTDVQTSRASELPEPPCHQTIDDITIVSTVSHALDVISTKDYLAIRANPAETNNARCETGRVPDPGNRIYKVCFKGLPEIIVTGNLDGWSVIGDYTIVFKKTHKNKQ